MNENISTILSENTVSGAGSEAFKVIVCGGLAVGILDCAAASFNGVFKGVSPLIVWQYVASGLLGRSSYNYGWKSVILGLLIHFFIAFSVTIIYYVASRRLSILVRQALLFGTLYGIAVYFVMGFIVTPLSAAGKMPFSVLSMLIGALIHIFASDSRLLLLPGGLLKTIEKIVLSLTKAELLCLISSVYKFMSDLLQTTEKTKLKRLPKRGNFEREIIYKILDEAFVCHVGFTVDEQPFVIPTAYARVGDNLLIHGSSASRMMRAMAWEKQICVTVTLVDGLVLARSAFHHSMNYRSVVIFGKAKLISDEREKSGALRAFTEHIVPNRWSEIRPPNANELKATTILSLHLSEASAKMRTGNPVDDEEDYALDVWAGTIPLKMSAGKPISDAKLKEGIEIPRDLSAYKRG